MLSRLFFILGISLLSTHARADTLWVYTSIYKEYSAQLKQAFEKLNPSHTLQIFQTGSEKIQTKIEAELMAKRVKADLVLSSDPFWCSKLQERQLLEKPSFENFCAPNYYSLMVLIAHSSLPEAQRPKTFQDLTRPEFRNQIAMGSPLESGTFFATVADLSDRYGWPYFKALQKNEVFAGGGNSSVIQKVESGEKKVGIVLLENALSAKKKKSPIEIIYPQDGALPIPSVRMLLKSSPSKPLAEQFMKFIAGVEGQSILRGAYVYPALQKVAAPEGARALREVTTGVPEWTPERIQRFAHESLSIKRKFAALLLD